MELNPNHPVTQAVSDHWHKICALIMSKGGHRHIVITKEDIARLDNAAIAIAIEEKPDGIHVVLLPMAEAERLAKIAGGLPV